MIQGQVCYSLAEAFAAILTSKLITHEDTKPLFPRLAAPLTQIDVVNQSNNAWNLVCHMLRAKNSCWVDLDRLHGTLPHKPHRSHHLDHAYGFVGRAQEQYFSIENGHRKIPKSKYLFRLVVASALESDSLAYQANALPHELCDHGFFHDDNLRRLNHTWQLQREFYL